MKTSKNDVDILVLFPRLSPLFAFDTPGFRRACNSLYAIGQGRMVSTITGGKRKVQHKQGEH